MRDLKPIFIIKMTGVRLCALKGLKRFVKLFPTVTTKTNIFNFNSYLKIISERKKRKEKQLSIYKDKPILCNFPEKKKQKMSYNEQSCPVFQKRELLPGNSCNAYPVSPAHFYSSFGRG